MPCEHIEFERRIGTGNSEIPLSVQHRTNLQSFQIKILFSDKTGTLTKNEMILQHCSIGGKIYKIQNFGVQEEDNPGVLRLPQYDRNMLSFFQTLSICHTVQVAKLDRTDKEEEDDANVDKSFEMVDSPGSLVDIEDAKRDSETQQNTKQNEVCIPENLLNNLPLAVERKRQTNKINTIETIFKIDQMIFVFSSSRASSSGECIKRHA